MLFKKVFEYGKIKGIFCAQKSQEIEKKKKKKMCSTLKISSCITKGILAIICSNSFSNRKVDQKNTEAISQTVNHVQLHVH